MISLIEPYFGCVKSFSACVKEILFKRTLSTDENPIYLKKEITSSRVAASTYTLEHFPNLGRFLQWKFEESRMKNSLSKTIISKGADCMIA